MKILVYSTLRNINLTNRSKTEERRTLSRLHNSCYRRDYLDSPDFRSVSIAVNISAVIIVVSVIAGILLVIFISCLCYCCCRFHAYRQARAKKQGEKWNFVSRIHSFVRVDVRNGVRPHYIAVISFVDFSNKLFVEHLSHTL